jgi:branched-chain amino acid transport system permease protein
VIVAVLMFLLALAHIRMRPGRAWAAIRQSEAAALAAGINTTLYKLWALALASFVTGVAGGLLAGASRYLYSFDFQTQDSITLLAVVLMGGIFSLWGAIIAGLFLQLLPALFNTWGISTDWRTILFGVGVLVTVTTAPDGVVGQVTGLVQALTARWRRGEPPGGGGGDRDAGSAAEQGDPVVAAHGGPR